MRRLLLVVTILISCVGCDQTTKSVAKAYLSETETISLLGDSVRLQIAKNYGAFLSAGASLPGELRSKVFSAGVALVLAVLLAYAFMSKKINPIVAGATALIVGGGLSNLIDRLAYGGYVLDFVNIGIGPVRTGIFNAADMCIMLGVALWICGDRLWRSALAISNGKLPSGQSSRERK
jgi:signal peptidase II